MKQLILFTLAILVSNTTLAQEAKSSSELPKNLEYPKFTSSDTIIKHTGYTLNWCPAYKQAKWVAYELTKEETKATVKRKDVFIPDTLVKTPTDFKKDYEEPLYDRGHLASAADMCWSEPTMKESFCYTNMSPQIAGFNRGIWKQLEEKVRDWAIENGTIYIVTGPVLSNDLKTIGTNKIAVPKYYYKVILVANSTTAKGIGFLMPNEKSSQSLQKFAVSIDSVEQVTGLDFYHQLSDKMEFSAEKNLCISCWNWNATSPVNTSTSSSAKETSTSTTNKAVQCSAKTKSGARCKNKTTNKSGICSVHEKK